MSQPKFLAEKCKQCGKMLDDKTLISLSDDLDFTFCSENCLYHHFEAEIEHFEKEYKENRKKSDFAVDEIENSEECLESLLDDPDEIWEDKETLPNVVVHNFIGEFEVDEEVFNYVACTFMKNSEPTFVFLHFPSREKSFVELYRRGKLIFKKSNTEIEIAASENDALSEGDETAQNLFQAMLQFRVEKDVPESEFVNHLEKRDVTIEEYEEIWKSNDLSGNTLVTFIREWAHDGKKMWYIVVTIEDVISNNHYILFSFPTKDKNLIERYRTGQNLINEFQTVKSEPH